MDETLFYVAGIALILIALGISAIGMRSDDFPSTGVLRAGVLLTVAVVAITAFGAVTLSVAEQETREAEENEAAALAEEELTVENEESGAGEGPGDAGPEPTEEDAQTPGNAAGPPETTGDAGSAVFIENGCGSCHTLADLSDQALGQIGPNLDEALVDKDPDYIETAILDPSAAVAEGFSDGIMPAGFADQIAPEDLDALVGYLSEATSDASGASGATGKK